MAEVADKMNAMAPLQDAVVGTARRYYSLVLITLICTVNFLDRNVLSVLLEPIRRELAVSDTQIGFLTGIAFTAVNVTLSLPVARLADRWSRRKVIAIAVTVWSAATALCGVAQNFVQLIFARFGVGAGQSGGSAPCYAFIGDLFPRQQRATAISIVLLSVPAGQALGFLWGGWALGALGWRHAIILAGIPGLILGALALLTLPEPPKGMADGVQEELPQIPFWRAIPLLWSIKSFRNMILASMLQSFLQLGLTAWVPAFLMRSYKMSPAAIGTGMATAFMLGLGLGGLIGGRSIDVLGRRDLRWHFWMPTIAVILAVGFSVAAFSAPPRYVFVLLTLQIFFGGLFSPAFTAITQALVPIAIRTVALAASLFVVNSFAIGIGPLLMGIASDFLRPRFGDNSLHITLVGAAAISLPAAIFYFLASFSYRAEVAAADAANKA